MRRCGVVLSLLVAACGDGDGATGPVATFDVPASGAIAWGAAPFPSDLFLGDDGTVDLASLPSTTPVWESVRELVNARRGFCGTCAIHFPIRGVLDPATVADGAVLVDPDGMRIDIDVDWSEREGVVAIRPKRGIVLTSGKRYVAALTDAIRGTDGSALRADAGMHSARANAITGPALEVLTAAGVPAGSVAAVTAFTVEDPTVLSQEIKARVDAYYATNGAPTLTVDRVWRASDGTLDELMGIPAENRPGFDVPAMAGMEGLYGVQHETTAFVIKGRFSSVRVITGTGTELGTLRPDAVAGDEVPFVLAIPSGVDVSQLPVIVLANGAGNDLALPLSLADLAGHAGAALLAFETFQHGERSTSSADRIHNLRADTGSLGPDGFSEHTVLSVGLRLFAIEGAPADQKASMAYVAGTFSQMVADLHALLAAVRTSDVAPLRGADASLAGLAFDEQRVFFLGLSLGTLVGAATLVSDDTVAAAAFNVPIAGLMETMIENNDFRTQLDLFMLPPLGITGQFEPEHPLALHPLMSFAQWTLHPFEPPALAPHLVARPGRDLMWQTAGLDELAGAYPGDGLIAATGVPAFGTYASATVRTGTPPFAHAGAWRFAQADHFMIARNAGASNVEPPAQPPFELRPTPLLFTNPVADVQRQLTHFYDTRRTTGTAEIAAP